MQPPLVDAPTLPIGQALPVGVLRSRLAASRAAMADVVVQPQLRRAELAFAIAWTSEAAFTVSLGVVAFRDGGATAVGLVALLRMVPSAVLSPLLVAVADRVRRERVLAVAAAVLAPPLGTAALAARAGAPPAALYALAVVSTIAFTACRPAHAALLPSPAATARDVTRANLLRGLL